MSNSHILIALVLCCCSPLALADGFFGDFTSRFFGSDQDEGLTMDMTSLNKWLSKEATNANDLEASVHEASEYLAKHSNELDSDERIEWRQFADLAKISPTNRCNIDTVDALKAVSCVSNKSGKVKKITKHYINKHSQECAKVYSNQFEDLVKQLDEKDIKLVNTLNLEFEVKLRVRIPLPKYEFVWPNYMPFVQHFREVDHVAPEATLAAIRSLTPGQDSHLNRDHIEESVQEFSNSCKLFMDKLDMLFALASFDADTNYEPQYGSDHFMLGWMQHEVCRRFISLDEKQLVDRVMKVVS